MLMDARKGLSLGLACLTVAVGFSLAAGGAHARSWLNVDESEGTVLLPLGVSAAFAHRLELQAHFIIHSLLCLHDDRSCAHVCHASPCVFIGP